MHSCTICKSVASDGMQRKKHAYIAALPARSDAFDDMQGHMTSS